VYQKPHPKPPIEIKKIKHIPDGEGMQNSDGKNDLCCETCRYGRTGKCLYSYHIDVKYMDGKGMPLPSKRFCENYMQHNLL